MGAVEGHGGQYGKYLGFKVFLQIFLHFGAEVFAFVDVDTFLCEGGFEVLAPAAAGLGLEGEEGSEDLLHLLSGGHAVRRAFEDAAADLAQQTGDPDHHELVDVVCEDGEEFDAFKEGVAEICGFFEDAAVELNEGDFSVDVEGFVREADLRTERVADIIGGHLYGVSKGLLYVYLVSIGISPFYRNTIENRNGCCDECDAENVLGRSFSGNCCLVGGRGEKKPPQILTAEPPPGPGIYYIISYHHSPENRKRIILQEHLPRERYLNK